MLRASSPTQRRGRVIENLAREYLLDQGLSLVQPNFNCRFGEIDLIMSDPTGIPAPQLVFIEVRFRRSFGHGGPAASVDHRKQRKLRRCASLYLQGDHGRSFPCARFDVIAVTGMINTPRFDWIRSAFE